MINQPPISLLVHGPTVQLFDRQTVDGISNSYIDCSFYNAVVIVITPLTAGASCDAAVLGSPSQVMGYKALPDINASKTGITSAYILECPVGQWFAKLQLSNVVGQWTAAGNGFFSPGMPRVSASIVVDTLAAIQANIGTANISDKITLDGTASAIAIGATPPTSALVGTGIWIDRTGMYGLNADTLEAKFDAVTGEIIAGAGNVKLNATGLVINTQSSSLALWHSGDTHPTAYMDAISNGISSQWYALVTNPSTNANLASMWLDSTGLNMGYGSGNLYLNDIYPGRQVVPTRYIGDNGTNTTISAGLSVAGNILAGGTISLGTNPAQSGYVRMPNSQGIYWRNAANNADILGMWVDSSNQVALGTGLNMGAQGITNVYSVAVNNGVGFYGTLPTTQQTITGSKGGNVALANLLTALASYGLLVDSTT